VEKYQPGVGRHQTTIYEFYGFGAFQIIMELHGASWSSS
jgi:hypothetical protein